MSAIILISESLDEVNNRSSNGLFRLASDFGGEMRLAVPQENSLMSFTKLVLSNGYSGVVGIRYIDEIAIGQPIIRSYPFSPN